MKKIICFGEVLIDFLNTGTEPDGALLLNNFIQFPGGAPANAAVAIAKLGGNAAFSGQVGDDPFGHFLLRALETYGVDTTLTCIHPSAKTPLAFVFLDGQGERSFLFYREDTADVVFEKSQVNEEWFSNEPIFHFCSNTLTTNHISDVTRHMVSLAKGRGGLISFDVNLRHNLWMSGSADIAMINDLVYESHLVKYASEEIDYLSRGKHEDYLEGCFAAGVQAVLITDGGGAVAVHTIDGKIHIDPPKVQAVDTTGGGDSFIGAVLYGISQQADPYNCLRDVESLRPLVQFATHCGAFTVARQGAFPALPTFSDVENEWKQQ